MMRLRMLTIGGALLSLAAPSTMDAQALVADAPPRACRAASVQGVAPGTPLVLTRRGGAPVRGRFLALRGDSIAVETAVARESIALAEVRRIDRAVRQRRNLVMSMALGGAIVGATELVSSRPEVGEGIALGALLVGLPVGLLRNAVQSAAPPLCSNP